MSECALGRLGGRTKVGRGRPCRPICVACGWGDSMKRHIGLGSRSLGCIPVHKVRCSRWAHPRHLGVLRLSGLSDKTDRQSFFSACMAWSKPKRQSSRGGESLDCEGQRGGCGGEWPVEDGISRVEGPPFDPVHDRWNPVVRCRWARHERERSTWRG